MLTQFCRQIRQKLWAGMQNNQSEYSCYYGGTNSKNGTEEIVSEEATSTSIDTIHHAMLIAKCGFFATNDRTWFLYDFAAKGVSKPRRI
ncbi:MAG: hypothetical protein GPJ20_21250 [Microcystis aeruginosa BS13-10]|nr:hypothetical protein [Microcystis aeruginosa BS13-10]